MDFGQKGISIGRGGSMNFNQSIIFYLNKKALDGFIIVSMTATETHESEARDIIGSVRILPSNSQ